MASILDSREAVLKIDPKNALRSIEQIGSQVKQIWELTSQLDLDDSYQHITNVVVAGMGGSAYGTHVIQTLFKDELKIPVTVIPDYTLPAYVNEQSLVIVTSYSGSSEETLSAAADAKRKNAKIIGLTSGGKLGEWLKTNQYPFIQFDGQFNPCGVARFGYGYSLFGQLAIFAKVGLIALSQANVDKILEIIAQSHLKYSADITQEQNVAKLLAFSLIDHTPVFIISEHLEGVAHIVANAINENSKNYSEFRVIPELNHHLLEGLQFPTTSERHYIFVTTDSLLYEKSNRKRLTLTQQMLSKFNLEHVPLDVFGSSKLEEAFSYLMLGVYTSYYLGILNNQDPASTPQVEWFKNELKK